LIVLFLRLSLPMRFRIPPSPNRSGGVLHSCSNSSSNSLRIFIGFIVGNCVS
jgi:hypothetical protein